MKNLKNMMSAASLTAVLVFGAVSANAELLRGDRTKNPTEVQCTVKSGGFLKGLAGFINELTGITIFDTSCKTDNEILMDGFRRGG
ncbi:MAG: hypothetical protein ACR2MG_17375 [Pyrinomonadaceae bacterium]